jgi:hypothetical protein
MNVYVDMIETAELALRLRNWAQRSLDEALRAQLRTDGTTNDAISTAQRWQWGRFATRPALRPALRGAR